MTPHACFRYTQPHLSCCLCCCLSLVSQSAALQHSSTADGALMLHSWRASAHQLQSSSLASRCCCSVGALLALFWWPENLNTACLVSIVHLSIWVEQTNGPHCMHLLACRRRAQQGFLRQLHKPHEAVLPSIHSRWRSLYNHGTRHMSASVCKHVLAALEAFHRCG